MQLAPAATGPQQWETGVYAAPESSGAWLEAELGATNGSLPLRGGGRDLASQQFPAATLPKIATADLAHFGTFCRRGLEGEFSYPQIIRLQMDFPL